jgi:hypothetical protein
MPKPAIIDMFSQQSSLPSLMHPYNGTKVFVLGLFYLFLFCFGGGCLLGLLFPCVLGVAFFYMALSLCYLSTRDAP